MKSSRSTPGFYRSWEVSRRTGASLRMLQWWDERKLLIPIREGHTRLYSEEQLAAAKRLADLRRAGASLQQVRRLKLLQVPCERVVGLKGRPTLVGDVLVVP